MLKVQLPKKNVQVLPKYVEPFDAGQLMRRVATLMRFRWNLSVKLRKFSKFTLTFEAYRVSGKMHSLNAVIPLYQGYNHEAIGSTA
jgi:hypothetical protein